MMMFRRGYQFREAFSRENLTAFPAAVLQMVQLAWEAHPVGFIGVIAVQLFSGSLPIATAWITKSLFDILGQALQGETASDLPQQIVILLAIQAGLTIAGQLVSSLERFLNSELSRRLMLKTQALIYGKIGTLEGLAYFEDPKFHDMIRLATRGAQMGPLQMLNGLTSMAQGLVTLLSFLGVLLVFNPLLAVIVLLVSVPQLYTQLKIGRRRFRLAFMNSPKERRAVYLGTLLSEDMFAKEVRLFGLSRYFLDQFIQLYREIQQAQREQEVREIRWQLFLSIMSSLVASGAFIMVVLQAFARHITLGDVTLYTNALSSVQRAMERIIYAFAGLNENVLFYAQFKDLMALPSTLKVAENPVPIPTLRHGIELRNVSFRYSEQLPYVLRDVNLLIPAGQCLALVGLNGAGKTTLVKLLTRLYDPTEGQILWDGVDIREFDLAELRRRTGAIFQDFVRYSLTARENIGVGDVAYIEDLPHVADAAQDVGIDAFIRGLPEGYETILSRWLVDDKTGVDLSGGQWQKVGTARMFMREADFLILDEPTAALDAQAEYETYERFVELVAGRTCVLISHRFSTVRMANVIAVLENGVITEYGSHEELMANAATYAKLYNMQAERYTQGVSRPLGEVPPTVHFRGKPPDGGDRFTVLWNPGEDV
jgi:ATP-binding cassette subfamily B protein